MRRTALVSATALALTALPLAASGDAADTGRPITVAMTGAAERPDPGDPDGSGTAHFRINPGQEQLCYTLEVSDIAAATAAHIHVAGPDVAGPVVIPLAPPTTGMSSGCVDADRALLRTIMTDLDGYYVNVHNAEFPGGAVRGQLG